MREFQRGQNAETLSQQSRLLLSQLSVELGFPLAVSRWSERGSGQPTHPELPIGWFASISHRQGRIAVGLATVPIGIDLECWQPRHTARLSDFIQLLPEAAIAHQIEQSTDPQRSFYKAYTLYEALYKLSSAAGRPVEGIFDTQIDSIRPNGELIAWQWEEAEWILSVAAIEGTTPLSLLASPPISLQSSEALLNQEWLGEASVIGSMNDVVCNSNRSIEYRDITLMTSTESCSISDSFTSRPAIRSLWVGSD